MTIFPPPPGPLHSLLNRQLRRAFGANNAAPETIAPLLAMVDRSYRDADGQRELVEHSLATMSQELNARNLELATQLERVRNQARILEHIHDAVFAINSLGQVLSANPATERLFGLESPELAHRELSALVRVAGDKSTVPSVLESARVAGRWVGDLHLLEPPGDGAQIETTIVHQGGATGDLAEFVAVGRDVTDRRLMERQLFQSQKLEAIGQLAAGIAHEINTPAQYVADNLRFLQEGFAALESALGRLRSAEPSTPEMDDELEIFREEIPSAIRQSLDGMARVAAIVSGMRTFAHPGGGEKSMVDLNAELAATITVTRNEWKYVSEVVTEFDPDLPPVPAIAGEINHVFLNIIVNAAHAIEERVKKQGDSPGQIRVSTSIDAEAVEVRISDNGSGIPDTIRDRVFDPFFTTKAVGRGTGQGLAIAHRLVTEKHGGTIRFEPARPHGTTFIIRLPLAVSASTGICEAA
ncbi:MAG: PAS domain S-box protein [Candidatus Eisenbacteria bacterium]|nr:PAS domain S-box protein [Candidatus Eisenbacteria bacterium]